MNEVVSTRADGIGTAGELAKVVRRLPKYAKLVWLLLKDPDLTARQRTALMAAVGYSISPVDAIPGIIPVIGQLDDLAVLLFTVLWVLRSMPAGRAAEYLSRSALSVQVLDEDLRLVKHTGVRILKRMFALMGVAALTAWGLGKFAARGILRELRKHAQSARRRRHIRS